MDSDFVHLHVHSEYSLLDGACRVRPLVERVKELGMFAVALTDHGSLSGAVQFYRAAMKERYAHLTMLARDDEGYANLIKIATAAYLEGYYYKPRADWELLGRYNSGLICLTGCMSGQASLLLRQ